jgi:cation:H+ antiporter
MSDWISIAAGLVLLLVAAELLVRGSVWIALALGVSPMVVGLTLVAFGTSAPELVVGITAVLDDVPGIATGSVFGSNVANIALIVGLAATVRPIDHASKSAKFECRFLIVASAFLLIPLFAGTALTRGHGLILLGGLGAFTLFLLARETRRRRAVRRAGEVEERPAHRAGVAVLHALFVVAGLTGLKFGGEILVDGAVGVARTLGMTEAVIGLTIVAVGTSLPELATSVVAARKGHPEIALGNVLGSNVFNIGMVLGATAVIRPLPMDWRSEGPSVVVGLGLAVLLAILLRRGRLGRPVGIGLLLLYAAYVTGTVRAG